eukprot:CAMPEP_0119481230 /NCGR_PEP_ID=MMETSP1344-20130328/9668_1 /TAXON_ID=236787 /ORGANISM="Florenciella parvula, Strain CCMP2471" /LENGTH=841 /DNA_ID=CAMNT_0007515599 /DNA_START=58 /DNA_END=2580 /DNA_ORIENTATION=-
MSVGEIMVWGEQTGGDATSMEQWRSFRISNLCGAYESATALHDTMASDMLGDTRTGSLTGIADVQVGETHKLILRDDGEVLATGVGKRGQLGLGAKVLETKEYLPLASLRDKKVKQIACGETHSAAVTETGDVFTWGCGFQGQTGHATIGSKDRPCDSATNDRLTGVQLLPKVVGSFVRKEKIASVSCGARHTSVITSLGEVWCWGEGKCGQLGYGKVRFNSRPRLTIAACPVKGAPFDAVTCGYAHTIAKTTTGRLYSWGFNAYGQLGLGHSDSQFEPAPVEVMGRDGNSCVVREVKASGNYSAALSERGDIYTFGCGGHGRLGHGSNEHMYVPTLMLGIEGKQVSHFVMTAKNMYVFVPSVVCKVEPPCGPLSGGTTVFVHGGGFWDAEDMTMRFSPTTVPKKGSNVVARSSQGTYVRDADFDSGVMQQIKCNAPRFNDPGEMSLEVAMNGHDFTDSGITYTYYADPVVESIQPPCFSATNPRELLIQGSGFYETGLVKIRFKEKPGGEDREELVEGTCVSEKNVEFNPDTEEEEIVEVVSIICNSPVFGGELFPIDTRVAVALNGKDFVTLPGTSVMVHNCNLKGTTPMSAPIEGGTAVSVEGTSFYPSPTLGVRISIPDPYVEPPEEKEVDALEIEEQKSFTSQPEPKPFAEIKVRAEFVSSTEMTFVMPTEGLFDNEDVYKYLFPNPSVLSVAAVLEATIDGEGYLDSKIPFYFFRQAEFNLEPATGPTKGGTEVKLTFEGVVFESTEAVVTFDATDALSDGQGMSSTVGAVCTTTKTQTIMTCVTEPWKSDDLSADLRPEGGSVDMGDEEATAATELAETAAAEEAPAEDTAAVE